jgi:uncharacterized cupin superfamily protein
VSTYASNAWTDDLFDLGGGVRAARLTRTDGSHLVAGVWELDPGASVVYHLHHGTEEYLLVLRGRLTLRTADGDRVLTDGDVAHFPKGRDGAHGTRNDSDGVVRYLVAANHGTPEVIEYPDTGIVVVGAETPSQDGNALELAFRAGDAVDPAERSG